MLLFHWSQQHFPKLLDISLVLKGFLEREKPIHKGTHKKYWYSMHFETFFTKTESGNTGNVDISLVLYCFFLWEDMIVYRPEKKEPTKYWNSIGFYVCSMKTDSRNTEHVNISLVLSCFFVRGHDWLLTRTQKMLIFHWF